MLVVVSCACGGATEVVAEPTPTVTLPTAAPPPPPPPPRMVNTSQSSETMITVDFAEVRRHPEASRVDTMLRYAPAWRAFPSIDPVRDLDWLVQNGDDMIVAHVTPDTGVDAAIAAVAQPITLATGGVKAWRGVVNGFDTVFLRAEPHVVRIVRAAHAEMAARDLLAHPPSRPTFHAGEAARVRKIHPAAEMREIPEDISEMRAWVDSTPADSGADLEAEADCPDAAAAQNDAMILATLVRNKNTFAVRMMSGGLLNTVQVWPVGDHVRLHAHATAQQIESVMSLASTLYGRGP
jgi:hypothetical protein